MTDRTRFVAGRLLQAIPLLLGVTLLVILMVHVTPGSPARSILGPRASDAEVAALDQKLGYDAGIVTQFTTYVGDVVSGDLGESVKTGTPVTTTLKDGGAPTLYLLISGAIFTLLLAVPLAAFSATRRDRAADHTIRLGMIIALFLPSFWIGFLLIRFVAIPTGWFPVSGFGETFGDHVRSVILPGITLALAMAPVLVRSLRSSMIDVLESDHVAAARSIGLRGFTLLRRSVLRNALPPTVTLLAVQLGFLLFGVVVIEYTFDIQGIGSALVTAAGQRDLPVLQGITLVFAIAVIVVNLVADLVVAALDPRVKPS